MKLSPFSKYLAAAALAAVASTGLARAALVDLGAAARFGALALTHGISDSGPIGPNGPYSINGTVGVASAGQVFQASGNVRISGDIFLHTGDTFNSSAPGVPQPQPQNATTDLVLGAARSAAFQASSFASSLMATTTYGTINSSLTIAESARGNYVFDIAGINYSGGSALTLSAPAGSLVLLNIGNGLSLTSGSILVAGGLTAADVLINYTGTSTVQFSGGGNSSQMYASLLAPNAGLSMHSGYIAGAVIADALTLDGGAQIGGVPSTTPVPEMSALFPVIALLVAVGSTRVLRRRKRASAAA